MAKKEERNLVDCLKCVYCGGKVENIMVDCSNKQRNPGGYKIGYWPQECKYFVRKQ